MNRDKYKEQYLKTDPSFISRYGRVVTIPGDVHRDIRRIITLAEIKGLTISSYIANVLRQHLDEWEYEIKDLCNPSSINY